MKRVFLLNLFIFFFFLAFCQQDPQFSQNMFDHMAINPGYVGSNDLICATAFNRQQWMGFDGGPTTSVFNINTPLNLFGISSGIGLSIINDKAGFEKDLGLNFSYAYRAKAGSGKLGIGFTFGVHNKSLDVKEWKTPDNTLNDDLIPAGNESTFVFDLGVGIFYKSDNLYFGISSMHLNEPKVEYNPTSIPYLKRHYYITAGYTIQLSNPLFEIHPSLFIQSIGTISQISVNTNVVYNKRFWGGVSYRLGDAIIGMLGLELFNGVKIGYAYDFITSDIGSYSNGSHEFMVGYCFSISVDKSPQRYKSVRFL